MAKQTPSPLLSYDPFPELAAALRSCTDQVILIWSKEVRQITPAARSLPFDQLVDNLPTILPRMAEALEVGYGEGLNKVASVSPAQGLARFHQNYDVRALVMEDRILRRIIIERVGAVLARPMTHGEQVALHMCIDEMVQHAVLAFVDLQNKQIRAGAESELKYLSFLSHDLNNNLSGVTLFMQVLRQRLADLPEFAEDVQTLDHAQQSILDTIGGMGRLLQSERLRKAGAEIKRGPVNLFRLATNVSQPSLRLAEKKGVRLTIDIAPDVVVTSDAELISLVLQNVLGNAVKYSAKGTICVGAHELDGDHDGQLVMTVSDEGPGIEQDGVDQIFEAFRRGESHGQPGVGLGLAIASQAAKLLGAELTVKSTVGVGSTFQLILLAHSRP